MARKAKPMPLPAAVPGPQITVSHCAFNGSKPELIALAEAVRANAEAIKALADRVYTGPLMQVGGKS